jgi:hypothetical protein
MITQAGMNRRQIIKRLFPNISETEVTEHVKKFGELIKQNEEAMTGKNQDYARGYNIGGYMAHNGQEFGSFSEMDEEINELLAETEWIDIPIDDVPEFKDGIAVGYTITSGLEEEEEEEE